MKNLFSLVFVLSLFVLSSCSKEYTCECTTVLGDITTESIIEASTKAKARTLCDENDAELLGIVIADCEII